jgi:hypothetical protein
MVEGWGFLMEDRTPVTRTPVAVLAAVGRVAVDQQY